MRGRAFEEAQYEIVTIVNDDNWVAPEWVATASRCMSIDPQLGAIGSANTAVADEPFPVWFSRNRGYYAVWDYPESATMATRLLVGAGMTIRRTVWLWLRTRGFHPHLTDRAGTRLTSCGDLELGCAIDSRAGTSASSPDWHFSTICLQSGFDGAICVGLCEG
jgi:hypothetical protein